ncbi:MAG TPA: DUF5979 domain-containing protein [Acidimicrobiia bacterium]|nr:DUF5979 domain-containing protein [Acidimicrobiia bacterium]
MVTLALGAGTLAAVGGTAGAGVDEDHVTICHRTNSNKNPYVEISPDKSGVLDGHAGHTGPVWNDTLKADHTKWGDIIPPFDDFPGQNWDAAGQAIYFPSEGKAACDPPGPPPEQQFGSLAVVKETLGLPLTVTPVSGTLPDHFTAHVLCDDLTETDVDLPLNGGPGTPALITGIEANSSCTVTELGVDGLPLGTVVTYASNPAFTVDGAPISANATTTVTITNDFREVEAEVVVRPNDPGDPVVAPAAVVVSPQFTG